MCTVWPRKTRRNIRFSTARTGGGIREGMRPFLNGRLPIPEDIANLLCGPVDWLEEGAHIREAVVRASAAFAGIVERILTEKEMDERVAEREDA